MSVSMSIILRWTATLAGLLVGLGLVMGGCLALIGAQPDLFRPLVEKALAPRGGATAITRLRVGLSPLTLTLDGVRTTTPSRGGLAVNLDHLHIVATPWEGLTGDRWLKRLTVVRPRLELQAAESTAEPPTGRRTPAALGGGPDLSLLGLVFGLEELNLEGGAFSWRSRGFEFGLEDLRIGLRPAESDRGGLSLEGRLVARGAGGELLFESGLIGRGSLSGKPQANLTISLEKGRISHPSVTGEVALRADLKADPREVVLVGANLTGHGLRFGSRGETIWADQDLRVGFSGRMGLGGQGIEVRLREAVLDGLGRFSGEVRSSEVGRLASRIEGLIEAPERILEGLKDQLPSGLKGTKIQGTLPFALSLDGLSAMRMELPLKEVGLDLPGLGLTSRITEGRVDLVGPLTGQLRMGGQFKARAGYSGPGVRIDRFSAEAVVGGTLLNPALDELRVRIEPGGLRLDRGRPPLGELNLTGAVQSGTDTRPEIILTSVESSELGLFRGRLGLGGQGLRGDLDCSELRSQGIWPILAWLGLKGEAWRLGGRTRLRVGLSGPPQRPVGSLELGFRETSLNSPDGRVMIDQLGGRLKLKAGLTGTGQVEAELNLDHGEALVGMVYANLTADPIQARVSAEPSGPDQPRGWSRIRLTGSWHHLGLIELSGKIWRGSKRWRYKGRLDMVDGDLQALFKTFVQEPLSISRPELADLRVGGKAGLRIGFTGLGGLLSVDGRVSLFGGRLARQESVLISGLDVDLPVKYRFGISGTAGPPEPGRDGWGRLRIGLAEFGGARLEGIETTIAVLPNRLFVGQPISISLLGGRARISGLEIDRPFSRKFEATFGLGLKGLDLGRLGSEALPLQGVLGGRLERVGLNQERLAARGQLTGALYDGGLVVEGIRLRRPFSSDRTAGADIYFEKLDLEKFSRALDIGRITGRLSGEIRNFRMAYGQLVGLDLKVVSVPVKGVKQRVNLKAVNTISVLGTGAGLEGLGVRLLTTFLKEFPYKQIGMGCSLENDVFTIRGLIRQGKTEYLVKKPMFSGINVINRNPNNRISFSDMKARLKRINSDDKPRID